MKTTLNKIKAAEACEERYKVLLQGLGKTEADDEELTIRRILKINGIEDAVWALRAVEGHDREIRLFACDCAEMVLPIHEKQSPDDNRPRKAIEVSRRYANGEATADELAAALAAAWAAVGDAARAAAWAATRAAEVDAAWDAEGDAARAAEWAATRSAAWAATRAAEVDAARAAALAAAWAAARDAALVAAWAAIKELLLKYI